MIMLHFYYSAASRLGEIQRHFLGRAFDAEGSREILLAVGGIAAIIGLIMLTIHFWPKKPYIPQDWITEAKAIRSLLTQALDRRTKFELQFASEGTTRRPALRCAGIALEGNELVLEASGLTTISERWAGRSIDCFFMLAEREGSHFHAFSAIISRINVARDMCFIRLKLPERVETRQKRSYLRIAPPAEYLLGAAIWRGLDIPEDEIRSNISLWAKPSLTLLPASREDFNVRDLSSGGLRLYLPRNMLSEEMEHIHVSTQFMLMLDLWDPDKNVRARYWMLCRMQSPTLDFETKGMDIGAQFLAWARPKEPGSSELLWLRLGPTGEVEPLGNWIMRRHLEYFRDAEQAEFKHTD